MHPLRTIVAPNPKTLKLWDELNLKRRVVGIGGADAHAHKVNLLGFFEVEVFPYKVLFRSIRTHILADTKIEISKDKQKIESAKQLILKSLSEGKCFVSNYYSGDAAGFRFFAESGGKIYQMGDTADFSNGEIKLKVVLPGKAGSIRLIKNGKLFNTVDDVEAEFIADQKGVYRIEVYMNNKAWIFSNHIRVGI
jgi:hypothetical protein